MNSCVKNTPLVRSGMGWRSRISHPSELRSWLLKSRYKFTRYWFFCSIISRNISCILPNLIHHAWTARFTSNDLPLWEYICKSTSCESAIVWVWNIDKITGMLPSEVKFYLVVVFDSETNKNKKNLAVCRSIGRVRFCWLVSESRPLLPLIVCSESCIHPKFSTLMWQTKACLLKSRRNFTSCCFFLLARFTLYSLHISPSNSSCPHCQTHAKCLTAARIRRLSISRRRAQAFSICQSARPSSRTCTAPKWKIYFLAAIRQL